MKIYFVRHGKTKNNLRGLTQGWKDSALTQQGINQAIITGKYLKDVKFGAIYASDLSRQFRTAEIILDQNDRTKNISIVKTRAFRELGFGVYEEGKFVELFRPYFEKFNLEIGDYDALIKRMNWFDCYCAIAENDPTHTVEHPYNAFERFKKELDKIVNNGDGNILVVSSAAILTIVFSCLFEDFDRTTHFENGSVSIVEYRNNQFKMLDVNHQTDTESSVSLS